MEKLVLQLNHNSSKNLITEAITACKSIFIYALIFSFISNILMLALPIYSLQVLDRVVSSSSIETLTMLTVVAFFAFLSLNLIQSAKSFMMIRMSEWLEQKLSGTLLTYSITAAALSNNNTGSQNLRDLNTLKGFIAGPQLATLFDTPWSVIFIVVLFFIHPVYGTITLCGGLILLGMAILNEKQTKQLLQNANEIFVKSMGQVEIATRNAEVIEAMGMANNVSKNWRDISKDGIVLQNKASDRAAVISGITKFFRMFIQLLITGAGGYLVIKHEITVGAIIAGSILVGRALGPFENSIASWKSVINVRQSYSRLVKSVTTTSLRDKGISLPEPKGSLKVENVVFAPMGATKPVLKSISFQLEPGEILGIIGPSGSGKSTLAKLIASVYKPNNGVVRFDGADIYTWNREEIGKYIGYLPQDVELFNGDVKTNIARMAPSDEIDDKQVIAAAKIANVHEMILSFSKGYETEIGVRGANLSAGQRQRVALARAFFGNIKLAILDEPNSNLDFDGDQALVKCLSYAKKHNITTIIISHRPAIMSAVDKILVLQDGTISEFGNRDEVLGKFSQQQTPNQQNIVKIAGKKEHAN